MYVLFTMKLVQSFVCVDLIKTYGLKVMTRNTFHGDPRPCIFVEVENTWPADGSGKFDRTSMETAKSCCMLSNKILASYNKLVARGASRDVHVSPHKILVDNSILAIISRCTIIRGYICTCVLAIA